MSADKPRVLTRLWPPMTSASCGLARLAEAVENSYVLKGG